MAKNNTPPEFEEQCTLVHYLEMKGLKFTAIPNSTYTKSWNQKRKNTLSGLRPGLPDMLVITPKGLLFIEMKRTAGSVTRKEQKDWISSLNALSGVEARVCFGAEDAIKFVEEFL